MRAMRSNMRARNVATIFWPLNAVKYDCPYDAALPMICETRMSAITSTSMSQCGCRTMTSCCRYSATLARVTGAMPATTPNSDPTTRRP